MGKITIQPKNLNNVPIEQGFKYNYLKYPSLLSQIQSDLKNTNDHDWLVIDLTMEHIDLLKWLDDNKHDLLNSLHTQTQVKDIILVNLNSLYFQEQLTYKSESDPNNLFHYFDYESNAWSIRSMATLMSSDNDDLLLKPIMNYQKYISDISHPSS